MGYGQFAWIGHPFFLFYIHYYKQKIDFFNLRKLNIRNMPRSLLAKTSTRRNVYFQASSLVN